MIKMHLYYSLAVYMVFFGLAKGQSCPEDVISRNINTYDLHSDVRLCWKCMSNVEYLCKKYVKLPTGQFTCEFGEEWRRDSPSCVSYSCEDGPGSIPIVRDDPNASAVGRFGSASMQATYDVPQSLNEYYVDRRPADVNPYAANDEETYEFGIFDAIKRSKFRGLKKSASSGPVDCSAVEHTFSESVCSGGFILNNRCYQLSVDKLSHKDAKMGCENNERKTEGNPGYFGLALIKEEETYDQILCYLMPFIEALDQENKKAVNVWLGATFFREVRWEDGEPQGEYQSPWMPGNPKDISTWTKLALHVQNEVGKHGIINRNGKIMKYYALCESPIPKQF